MNNKNKNPTQLTRRQHLIPRGCLIFFSDKKGLLKLNRLGTKLTHIKPNNPIFCAIDAWDQRAELLVMKPLEDKFIELIRDIHNNKLFVIDAHNQNIINQYFSLWYIRSRYEGFCTTNGIKAYGITPMPLNQNEKDILDKGHYLFFDENGHFPKRQINGLRVMLEINAKFQLMKNHTWRIVKATKGSFILPDTPKHDIIPITSTIALVSQTVSCPLVLDAGLLNKYLLHGVQKYYVF